jgi:TQXA domain-containing protein/LPXTG-motif cell wall-anchored protein
MLASGMAIGGGFAAAGGAAADEAPSGVGAGGATATLQPGLKQSGKVEIDGHSYAAGLFTLRTAQGGEIYTYCIDLHHHTKPKAEYQESDWGATSLAAKPESAGKIKWILENAYPTKSAQAAAQAAGISDGLTDGDAAAGTQAAIWHFSDGVQATPEDPEAAKLAEYLVAQAKNQQEPEPSLQLSPQAVSGKSGELAGPVTLNTNANAAALVLDGEAAKAGVKLTGKDGKELPATVGNGTDVYFSVPAGAAAGEAKLTATATTEVPVGRAFTSVGYTEADHSQTMILAGSHNVQVSAEASASWSNAKGPIPAAEAEERCSDSTVVVTVANNGDQDFVGTVNGESVTVKPGASQSVPVKVGEDQAYTIKVAGSNGFSEEFRGVLDCRTATVGDSSPAPSQSASTGSGTDDSTGGDDLAETGSSSATPVIAAVAGGLVVVGGGLVFLLRKRSRQS